MKRVTKLTAFLLALILALGCGVNAFASSADIVPAEPLTEAVTEAETGDSTETAINVETEAPTETVVEAGTETITEPTTDVETETVTEPTTEGETEIVTEPVAEDKTETPAEPTTEGKTETPAEPTTEGKTETPAEPTIEDKTETPAESTTEGKTEAPAETKDGEETVAKPTETETTEPAEGVDAISDETMERANVMAAPGISPLASPASLTIEQGKSGTSTLEHSVSSGFVCTAANGITVTNNGNKVTISVGQNVPTGNYSVTVKYRYKYWMREVDATETINVTVTEPGDDIRDASVFYLKTPTSDPRSNDTGNWGSPSVTNNASVNMKGANWEDTASERNKNVFDNVESFIVNWSDGTSGATWTLDKSTYSTVYQQVYDAYKAELEEKLGITGLTLDDIESITLIPVKISQNNGITADGQRDTHIDCRIDVKCSKAYVARFQVQYPGQESYTVVSAENKKIVNDVPDKITKYDDAVSAPATYEYDGVTYVFDGWYNEAGEKVSDSSWPYAPNADELDDGTVNFYAHYVPPTTSVTVSKTVTGNMGDKNKDFKFTYKAGENGQENTFSLKHSGSKTLDGLTIRQTLYIKEDADGYEPKVAYSVNGESSISVNAGNGWYAIPIRAGTAVSFVNEKEVTIDTGILLDAAPYIMILAVVAAGALLLLARRRKSGWR